MWLKPNKFERLFNGCLKATGMDVLQSNLLPSALASGLLPFALASGLLPSASADGKKRQNQIGFSRIKQYL